MQNKRKDHEPPPAIAEWGWRYHHMGIPTQGEIQDETFLPAYNLGFGGFDVSPFGIEWMRFGPECPIPELIQKVPHIAFEVDDIEFELQQHDFKIITPTNSPSEGVKVCMIEHNGAPIELIQFLKEK